MVLGQGLGIPRAAIRRLPSGRVFTTDQWADYLIYAKSGRRVFFDGRNDFYRQAFVESCLTMMRAESGWQKPLARYKVCVALLPINSSIAAALRRDPGWEEVDRGRESATFVRREGGKLKSEVR